jgi:hypothetical protein
MIEIVHNFEPSKFMWLWAKYVTGFNDKHHCTASLRGVYSKKFSRNNPLFAATPSVLFDEQPWNSYQAIYVCGVSKAGYSRKQNYSHNVHVAILPALGVNEEWSFECWRMSVKNGRFLRIPGLEHLPERYRTLPDEYTTCRIFRWAACHFCGGDQTIPPITSIMS